MAEEAAVSGPAGPGSTDLDAGAKLRSSPDTPVALAQGPEVKEGRSRERKTKEQKRAEAEARNRTHRTSRPLQSSLSTIEEEVAEAEKILQGLSLTLADPEIYQNKARCLEVLDAHTQAKRRVAELTAEWDRISSLM